MSFSFGSCSSSAMGAFSALRFCIVLTILFVAILSTAVLLTGPSNSHQSVESSNTFVERQNSSVRNLNRKFSRRRWAMEESKRVWGERCSQSDIAISQGATDPLPSGIPTYTVEVMNVCSTGCDISGIHLECGWFSSSHLINPNIFKRLKYNDCLVNNGQALGNGGSVSFKYASTFLFPLSVSSLVCS